MGLKYRSSSPWKEPLKENFRWLFFPKWRLKRMHTKILLELPHHVSESRPQMSMQDMAAQFSAFRALTGYEAAIQETARLTEEQIEIEEDRKAELDRELRLLAEACAEAPYVSITYFQPDEKKAGGAYVTVTGQVKRIDDYERTVKLLDGNKILIDRIVDLERVQQDG